MERYVVKKLVHNSKENSKSSVRIEATTGSLAGGIIQKKIASYLQVYVDSGDIEWFQHNSKENSKISRAAFANGIM